LELYQNFTLHYYALPEESVI